MTDLRESFRHLADAEPEATRIDPYAAVTASRARVRTARHRWLAVGTAVGSLVAAGALVVSTTGLPPYGSTEMSIPAAPVASPPPAALIPITALLEQWGFAPGPWQGRMAGDLPNAVVQLADSDTFAGVSTGVGTTVDRVEPRCGDACVVTKDIAGTLDNHWYFETVWTSTVDTIMGGVFWGPPGTAVSVVRRTYDNGAWTSVLMPGVLVASPDAHPKGPYVNFDRLRQLADAVGVPPVEFAEPGPLPGEVARAVLPGSGSSVAGDLKVGVDYLIWVRCVADDPKAEMSFRVLTGDKAEPLLSGTTPCDGMQSANTAFTYSWKQPHRIQVEVTGPANARGYAILASQS